MSALSRRKGANGEREVCALLSDEFGVPVKRHLGQARDSGCDILSLAPYAIEVKRRKAIAGLYEWLGQADVPKATPVLMLRADGKEWLVTMKFKDWCRLAREELAAG